MHDGKMTVHAVAKVDARRARAVRACTNVNARRAWYMHTSTARRRFFQGMHERHVHGVHVHPRRATDVHGLQNLHDVQVLSKSQCTSCIDRYHGVYNINARRLVSKWCARVKRVNARRAYGSMHVLQVKSTAWLVMHAVVGPTTWICANEPPALY
jgi:hypothetical protein